MIEVNNLTRRKIDASFFKKVAKIVLKGENKKGLNLSVAFVGMTRIKELNKKYRKKNKATDVLSFGYDDNSGEVVICPAKSKRTAFLLIHGILHILGYNHKEMEQRENFYLSKSVHAK